MATIREKLAQYGFSYTGQLTQHSAITRNCPHCEHPDVKDLQDLPVSSYEERMWKGCLLESNQKSVFVALADLASALSSIERGVKRKIITLVAGADRVLLSRTQSETNLIVHESGLSSTEALDRLIRKTLKALVQEPLLAENSPNRYILEASYPWSLAEARQSEAYWGYGSHALIIMSDNQILRKKAQRRQQTRQEKESTTLYGRMLGANDCLPLEETDTLEIIETAAALLPSAFNLQHALDMARKI